MVMTVSGGLYVLDAINPARGEFVLALRCKPHTLPPMSAPHRTIRRICTPLRTRSLRLNSLLLRRSAH